MICSVPELASPQNEDCKRKLNYEENPRHENTVTALSIIEALVKSS